MALEIEGKVIRLLPEEKGVNSQGREWKRRSFILETFGDYPKKVCFSAWGDKVETVNAFTVGKLIRINFSPESREYNERWYTDLRAIRIESLTDGPRVAETQSSTPEHREMKQPVENPFDDNNTEEENEDLPF